MTLECTKCKLCYEFLFDIIAKKVSFGPGMEQLPVVSNKDMMTKFEQKLLSILKVFYKIWTPESYDMKTKKAFGLFLMS